MCDISVYIPPEEEALSLSCQASSIKGMNGDVSQLHPIPPSRT